MRKILLGLGLVAVMTATAQTKDGGITAKMLQQIEKQQLPLPLDRSYEPDTLEEQVVCYADKFYSKSHVDHVRTVVETAQSLEKFGPEGVQKFLKWVDMFE